MLVTGEACPVRCYTSNRVLVAASLWALLSDNSLRYLWRLRWINDLPAGFSHFLGLHNRRKTRLASISLPLHRRPVLCRDWKFHRRKEREGGGTPERLFGIKMRWDWGKAALSAERVSFWQVLLRQQGDKCLSKAGGLVLFLHSNQHITLSAGRPECQQLRQTCGMDGGRI